MAKKPTKQPTKQPAPKPAAKPAAKKPAAQQSVVKGVAVLSAPELEKRLGDATTAVLSLAGKVGKLLPAPTRPAAAADVRPTVGRIVHFVLPDRSHCAAVVTTVWSDTCVNLRLDPGQGQTPESETPTSVLLGSPSSDPGTWHWPEREASAPTQPSSAPAPSGPGTFTPAAAIEQPEPSSNGEGQTTEEPAADQGQADQGQPAAETSAGADGGQ